MAQKTTLGVLALPGPIRVFVAKVPAPPGGPHDPGRITALMVYGVPGRTQTFLAKTAAPVPVIIPVRRQFFKIEGSSKTKFRRYFIVEED